MTEKISVSQEGNLQADIEKLKNPKPYKEKYETPEVQQLTQAIDILAKLQVENFTPNSRVAYDKLTHAKRYLEKILKKQFDAPEEKTE